MTNSEKYHPDICPAYLSGVVDRYMRERLLKKFRETGYNISGEQWHILMFLYLDDGLTQKELCQRTGKGKISIAKAINLLEANNLAVRIQSENDLRNKKTYLTSKGKKLEAPLTSLVRENIEEMLKGLSREKTAEYIKTLKNNINNIKE